MRACVRELIGKLTIKYHQQGKELVTLQSKLESVFPYCNDLSSKSEDGFQAHLSVGQFQGKVGNVMYLYVYVLFALIDSNKCFYRLKQKEK